MKCLSETRIHERLNIGANEKKLRLVLYDSDDPLRSVDGEKTNTRLAFVFRVANETMEVVCQAAIRTSVTAKETRIRVCFPRGAIINDI